MSTTALRFPYETPPAETEWHRVAEGVFWLRFPLPFALNHVHVWILRDGDGWFVVDSGIGGQRMHDLWDHVIATHLEGRPITRLLLTHFHPDHMGSAGYLCAKFQPELLMTEIEWTHARRLALDTQGSNSGQMARHYRMMGLPADTVTLMTSGGNRYARGLDVPPETFTSLHDGDRLQINGDAWQVLTGGGHSPHQAMLYSPARNIFISGDQVLPKISPNVSTWADTPTYDPLQDYLASLDSLGAIDSDPLVLPSHNLPFFGFSDRIAQLAAHHDERLEQIVDFCRGAPRTVFEITEASFARKLDHTQLTFAVGEMLAHANHLLGAQALAKEIGTDGIWRFRST